METRIGKSKPMWRQQFAVAAAVALAVASAWTWLVPAAHDMYGAMDGPAAWMMRARWDAGYAAAIFAMWTAMMVGMMLPAAAPVVLLYTRLASSDSAALLTRSYAFAGGYVLAWTGFSMAATALQWGLSAAGWLSPMMAATGAVPAGLLLLAAGTYQATPLKQRCLSRCRAPLAWLRVHWEPGVAGALRMGLRHGGYCLGCCWALMLLLFAGGVMSLPLITALTLLVLAEKLAPPFLRVDRWGSGFLIGAGLWVLCAPGAGI
jgi:predicted metal-binding membrane protein